jgi:hypothetical protein
MASSGAAELNRVCCTTSVVRPLKRSTMAFV